MPAICCRRRASRDSDDMRYASRRGAALQFTDRADASGLRCQPEPARGRRLRRVPFQLRLRFLAGRRRVAGESPSPSAAQRRFSIQALRHDDRLLPFGSFAESSNVVRWGQPRSTLMQTTLEDRNPATEPSIFCRCREPITSSFTSATPSRRRIFTRRLSGSKAWPTPDPETGVKDRVSYVIRQNKLTFVLTTPLRAENPIADHIYQAWRRGEVSGA